MIAEVVTSNIIAELREEEAEYYGLDSFAKGAREPIPSRNSNPRRPGGTSRRPQDGVQARHAPSGAKAPRGNAGLAGAGAASAMGAASGAAGAGANAAPMSPAAPIAPAAASAAAGAGAGLAAAVAGSHARRADSNLGQHAQADNDAPVLNGDAEGYGSYDEYAASHGHQPSERDRNAGYGFQGVLENARTGERIPLEYRNMMIGRETHCDICIPDGSVSRNHARLAMDDMGQWWIEDLGSTNGTKVNGRPTSRSKLRFGDQITFGTTVMIFQKG